MNATLSFAALLLLAIVLAASLRVQAAPAPVAAVEIAPQNVADAQRLHQLLQHELRLHAQ